MDKRGITEGFEREIRQTKDRFTQMMAFINFLGETMELAVENGKYLEAEQYKIMLKEIFEYELKLLDLEKKLMEAEFENKKLILMSNKGRFINS
jgi:hypothetical protein